ncbi:MAG TPA: translation initiation factor IF-3 [Candidatus Limihabitans stercoravium]|nr:translation initiation factor IF-3 [Candidatus Limihabitans stercoravium]
MFFVWQSVSVDHFFIVQEDITIKELQINNEIRDREIRLIGNEGQQLGIVSAYEGQRLAEEHGLDLVKISPNAVPPVCKLMDYSKYKYEQNKKEKEMKRNQKTIEVKEVWLSMTIDIGDLNTKAKIASKFIAEGNKVKATIRMRGRQQAYAQQGVEVMKKFAEILSDVAKIEKQPLTEGRNISMVISPITNK